MYRDDQDKRWMAYLDGQMSTSESLDFERTLGARDSARLEAEMRLESAISESLSAGPSCPVALWKDISVRMAGPAQVKAGRMAYWISRTTVVLAATAAIVFGAPYYEDYLDTPGVRAQSQVAIHETTRDEFSRGLQATTSMAAAEAYLRENNINLRLAGTVEVERGHRHHLEFLGACRGRCPEGTLYELRFWCCGEPVKLLIARRGTDGERVLRRAVRCRDAEELPVSDEYITAIIGGHDSSTLKKLLQPVRGNLT